MKKWTIFGIVVGSVALVLPASRPLKPKVHAVDYVHLFSAGRWGTDLDIWILPDDTYFHRVAHANTGKIKSQRSGTSTGLFMLLLEQVTEDKGWGITTASLEREVEAANQAGGTLAVADSNHDYLDIRAKGHGILIADFYAVESFSKL